MVTVTAAELQKQFGRCRELALKQPLSITHHGRESLVVMAADEYKRLKAFDTRRSYYAHEIPDDLLVELSKETPGYTTDLDHLVKP